MFDKTFKRHRVETKGVEINLVHGGCGPPLLLLHGYPQTHVMWHRIANQLFSHYHVVCPDLRGYGDSAKPTSDADHSPYSKRAMARDMCAVMSSLGFEKFFIAGHDRGGRVAHRLILDHPQRVDKACVMDIAPTYHMFKEADQNFATGYYHWFFLIQSPPLPERLIGADPEFFLVEKLKRSSGPGAAFHPEAMAEYIRCFKNPATIHASCEDYRAAASIDLKHDAEDLHRKLECPLHVLWGAKGFIHRTYNVLDVWREYAVEVTGKPLDCGHYLAEEAAKEVCAEFLVFFKK